MFPRYTSSGQQSYDQPPWATDDFVRTRGKNVVITYHCQQRETIDSKYFIRIKCIAKPPYSIPKPRLLLLQYYYSVNTHVH